MVRCVEKNNEEKVTKLLSSKEILKKKQSLWMSKNPKFDLGKFLEKTKNEPSRFGIKYVFVK